ncbi:hypothetical protein CHUAL_005779 [Chamberlinius hualienensis]
MDEKSAATSNIGETASVENGSIRSSSKRKPGEFGFMNYIKSDPRLKRFCPYKSDKNNYCPESGATQVEAKSKREQLSENQFIAIKDMNNEKEDGLNNFDTPQKIKPSLMAANLNGDGVADNSTAEIDENSSSIELESNVAKDVNGLPQPRKRLLSINERILHDFLYGEMVTREDDSRVDSDDDLTPPKPELKEQEVELEEGEMEHEFDDGFGDGEVEDAAASTEQRRRHVEFDVLDDLNENEDEDDFDDENNDFLEDSDNADEVPEEEIDAMLDEKLEEYRQLRHSKLEDEEQAHEEREKVVLKARGNDHFEVLPEGWIEVTHNSGMPIYLHKPTRVCTLSKPYFLGPGSARKHQVPITAIPCLHYRRELNKESEMEKQKNAEIENAVGLENSLQDGTVSKASQALPSAKIETVQENFKEKSIDHLELREYCTSLFEFKTITVRRFKTWAGRRKHQQRLKQMHRPTLPSGTKLITCPLPPSNDKDDKGHGNPRRAEFVMNPNGKSHVCILHEYVQHAMKVQPRYMFKELENASTPYSATVVINDMAYGVGCGSSKKYAKLHAAKQTLEILIPQMKNLNPDDKAQSSQQDFKFFDQVKVGDPRVSELCAKAGQPSPYQILLECLKRNYGMGDTQIKFETQTLKHQKNEFTMTVGKHQAKVICKNKRDGKQRASQAILQRMHPHIPSWGSLLRLYGKGSCKTLKEKKQEEQQITELQCRTTANKPNQLILDKLRDELIKLRKTRELMKPIGKFIPTDVEPPSSSGCNLKNVDL